MAFTYNSSSKVTGLSSSNPIQFNFTAGANSKLVVLTLAALGGGISDVTGGVAPTYNGNNMTQCGTTQTSAEGATAMWYYLSPDASTTRQISITNGSAYSIRYTCTDYTNASYSAQFTNSGGASNGDAADVPASVTSVLDGSVCVSVMVHGEKDQFASITGGTTLVTTPSIDEGALQSGAAYSIKSGAGTETHTYVSGGSSDDYNFVMGAWEEYSAPIIEPASGQGNISIAATGAAVRTRLATGAPALSVASTGAAIRSRTASGQSDISVSATGTAGRLRPASGSAAISLTSTGTAGVLQKVSGQGDVSITATATAVVTRKVSGQADISITATGSMQDRPTGGMPHALLKPIRRMRLNLTHELSRGLVGAWLMNEGCGTAFIDASGNKYDGTGFGTEWSAGPHGSKVDFDNLDYIDVGSARQMSASGFAAGNFTIVASGKPISWGANDSFIENRHGSTANYFQLVTVSSGRIRFMYHDGSLHFNADVSGLDVNKPHQYVATVDLASNVKLYIDGKYRDSDVAPVASLSAGQTVRFGSPNWGFDGFIDYEFIYNRALTASEVRQLYRDPFQMFEDAEFESVPLLMPSGGIVQAQGSASISISATGSLQDRPTGGTPHALLKPIRGTRLNLTHKLARGIVGCWLMNEGSGLPKDISGYSGNTVLLAGSNPPYVPGKFGHSLDFNGTDAIKVPETTPTASNLSDTAFSVSFWCYVDDFSTSYGLVSRRQDAYPIWTIYTNGDGWTYALANDGGNQLLSQIFLSDYVAAGVWHHLVFTVTRTKSVLYLNGGQTQHISTSSALSGIQDYAQPIDFGRARFRNNLAGGLDNIQIWNRVLSAAEVRSLYRDPFQMFDREDVPSVAVLAPPLGLVAASGQSNIAISATANATVMRSATAQSNIAISATANATVIRGATAQSNIAISATGTAGRTRLAAGAALLQLLGFGDAIVSADKLASGQGNISISAAGNATVIRRATAQSNIAISATAAARATKTASGQADIIITATGTGSTQGEVPASGQGNISISAAGNATVLAGASGAADIHVVSVASATKTAQVSGSAAIVLTASATAGQIIQASGSAGISISSQGAVVRQRVAVGSAAVTIVGSGQVIRTRTASGQADIVVGVAATMTRIRTVAGTSNIVLQVVGHAITQLAAQGQAAITIQATGTASGTARPGWLVGCNVGALNSVISRM